MAFEITEYNQARLATVTNRVEKHGDEDKPAVSIGLSIETENFILDRLDPTLRSNSIDTVKLPQKHEGWTLEVDNGIDEDEPLIFGGVKLSKFSVEPKQGGTVVLRFSAGTSDIDADRLGWLGMHHGDSIWIKLHAPKAKEDAIDGTQAAFDADHPNADDEQDAGSLFAEAHGDD